jgi:membrane-associated phospholipid phosphatase
MSGKRVASRTSAQLIPWAMTHSANSTNAHAIVAKAGANTPWVRVVVIGIVVIALAHLLDAPAWAHVRDPRIYERDWGRFLRILGFLPTWLIVAAAFRLNAGRGEGWRSRAGIMALAPTVGGICAELLKLVVRRLRPGQLSPAYHFRSFLDGPLSNVGMGMPSSHVMVAMSASVVLSRMFPRTRWLWYALVAGCAYTRVAAQAHYVSDTVAAAVCGWIVGELMAQWLQNKRPLEAIASSGR